MATLFEGITISDCATGLIPEALQSGQLMVGSAGAELASALLAEFHLAVDRAEFTDPSKAYADELIDCAVATVLLMVGMLVSEDAAGLPACPDPELTIAIKHRFEQRAANRDFIRRAVALLATVHFLDRFLEGDLHIDFSGRSEAIYDCVSLSTIERSAIKAAGEKRAYRHAGEHMSQWIEHRARGSAGLPPVPEGERAWFEMTFELLVGESLGPKDACPPNDAVLAWWGAALTYTMMRCDAMFPELV